MPSKSDEESELAVLRKEAALIMKAIIKAEVRFDVPETERLKRELKLLLDKIEEKEKNKKK
jgi:hypothetical protein